MIVPKTQPDLDIEVLRGQQLQLLDALTFGFDQLVA